MSDMKKLEVIGILTENMEEKLMNSRNIVPQKIRTVKRKVRVRNIWEETGVKVIKWNLKEKTKGFMKKCNIKNDISKTILEKDHPLDIKS